ncbi:helicase HerA-like domain-containing protein [Fusibacter bizertensis]
MEKLNIAKKNDGTYFGPCLDMINRHGLISGATGTGKTITMKLFVEKLSEKGIPTFLVDVKGDLNGFETSGKSSDKLVKRLEMLQESLPDFQTFPVQYWDLFGEKGLPIRTTISDMGPLLLARLLELNEVQSSILHTLFKLADDEGLLLLDFKDIKALVEYAYANSTSLPQGYGSLNKASLSAIIRQLNTFEQQNVSDFFGEQALEIEDFIGTEKGKGYINLVDASKLSMHPKLYSTFLLWLLSELYETFPEEGDLVQPKMVYFFDEAHLIFDKISPVLLNQIEQVVRLIRSKGIGIYFVTQSPTDIPDSVLGQLGNRIQHGLRAYTAKEIKQLKLAAQGFRVNPTLDIEKELLELGVGEALVSFLDEKGVPEVTERVQILAPSSAFGHVEEVNYFNHHSLNAKYQMPLDRASAFEKLHESANKVAQNAKGQDTSSNKSTPAQTPKKRGRKPDSMVEKVTKSFLSSLGRSVGSSLARGILGTLKKL